MKILLTMALAAVMTAGLLGTKAVLACGPTDLAHLHPGAKARPPIGWVQFCTRNPKECVAPYEVSARTALTLARWKELDRVNRYFNKAIEPVTDLDQYGVAENWTYAVTGKGDCEEYVLEKRRFLIRQGWSPASLLITVVIDKQNGGHAVLTVVTDHGDFILDNVTDDILPWSNSGLTFIKRQSSSNPNVWVDLGRVPGKPEAVTATTARR